LGTRFEIRVFGVARGALRSRLVLKKLAFELRERLDAEPGTDLPLGVAGH
jgi:hypothetical protein